MARGLKGRWNRNVIDPSDYYALLSDRDTGPAFPSSIAGPDHPLELPPPAIQGPYGTSAADTLTGTGTGERLLGLQGNDQISGGGGNDSLFGLAGSDTLYGEGDNDSLYGDSGNDSLYGGAGADFLYGDRNAAPALLSAAAQEVVDRTETQIGASDFAIIYQGASYSVSGLSAADHDLIFVNMARTINTTIPNGETLWLQSEVDAIEASGGGKALLGYLNVAKINDYVAYWNAAWTSNGLASGTPTGSAPAFLSSFDAANTRLVNYWEPAWQSLLFARVDTLVARGFSGIFLDDLLQYNDRNVGNPAQAIIDASRMRELVVAVAEHAIEQVRLTRGQAAADAFLIVVNGAPYINSDANAHSLDLAMQARFFAAVDGLLVENYFSQGLGYAIAQAVNEYGSRDIALLSVDTGVTTTQQRLDIEEAAITAGFLPETTSVTNYSENTSRFLPGALVLAGGSDLLDGGAGNDQMYGGTGNDVYRVEDAGDSVIESVGGGADSVYVALAVSNYTLTAGSEVELLSAIDPASTAAFDLTGNDFGNTIIGTAGVNTLIGGGGNDVLAGGNGNDFYRVEDAGDVVLEYAGGGADSVYAVISYTLGAGTQVELLSAIDPASTGAMNLTGNEFANTIIGTAGSNTLIGGGAADVLAGGAGNDFYRVEEAGDVVLEYAGGGADSVYAVTSYALGAGSQVELLSAIDPASTGAMNLTGNEFAQAIYGTAGANVLNGLGGADSLRGFAGADSFAFTAALGGGNVDTIVDFVSATDKIALDDALFGGIGSPGAFSAAAFFAGTAAHDGDDRIIYDGATGQLFYDADGNGGGAAIHFATLQGAPSLAASDFQVI